MPTHFSHSSFTHSFFFSNFSTLFSSWLYMHQWYQKHLFSVLVHPCLSLHLVFFYLAYSICITPMSPLPNITQPNFTQLSLRPAAPLSHFGLPACHSQQYFLTIYLVSPAKSYPSNLLCYKASCLACFLCQVSIFLLHLLLLLGILRPFLQNYPWIQSTSHPPLTPTDSIITHIFQYLYSHITYRHQIANSLANRWLH